MTQICWSLMDRISRILEPDERDAVLGDFTESGVTPEQALRDLLGLVVRRQAALWRDWRPWLALLGVVAPFGIVLSLVCRSWAGQSATTFYLYVNGWTLAYLESPGARLDLAQNIATVFLECLALTCWSWTSGFVIGFISRSSIYVNAALFCLVLVVEFLADPERVIRPVAPQHYNRVEPSPLMLYGLVFSLTLRAGLVLLPAVWGMRKALRVSTLQPLKTMLWAVATATMTWLETRHITSFVGWWHLRNTWEIRLLLIVIAWPAAFMVATASWRHWRSKVIGCALILTIVIILPVFAHTHTAKASLIGSVTNHRSAMIANANVIVRNRRTKVEYRTCSDKLGYYNFASLPVGIYDLIIEKQGFKKGVRENIPLNLGSRPIVNFSLQTDESLIRGIR